MTREQYLRMDKRVFALISVAMIYSVVVSAFEVSQLSAGGKGYIQLIACQKSHYPPVGTCSERKTSLRCLSYGLNNICHQYNSRTADSKPFIHVHNGRYQNRKCKNVYSAALIQTHHQQKNKCTAACHDRAANPLTFCNQKSCYFHNGEDDTGN